MAAVKLACLPFNTDNRHEGRPATLPRGPPWAAASHGSIDPMTWLAVVSFAAGVLAAAATSAAAHPLVLPEGCPPSCAGANLAGTRIINLDGADLRGADLRFADLRGAVQAGAFLLDATLVGAKLFDADLREAM